LLVKQGDENVELKGILTSYWLKASNDIVDIQSDVMLKKIKSRIKAEKPQQKISNVKRRNEKLFMFMRYAAIIVLTFGLSWFSKDLINNKIANNGNKEEKIADNEISVSYGSKSRIKLPDGSSVILNSGSTLKYPGRFDKLSRNVFITGEAYFDVSKDKEHPFYVKTNGITIKVLGTKFNVKSYPEEKIVQATLVTGSIELYSNRNGICKNNRLAILKPNQQAIIEIGNSKSTNGCKNNLDSIKSISINNQIDVVRYISWKDNRLDFRDEKFINLSHQLERWYNVEIEIKDDKMKETLLSGVFMKETIEQSLKALKLTMPFKYTINQNHIVILKINSRN
jgi:ferric-dicitrate binding protein FerR (iron transport regulator)